MDYDIDKLYVLAHTISKTGRFATGSNLTEYPLDVITLLNKPNGMTYTQTDAIDDDTIVVDNKTLSVLTTYPGANDVSIKKFIVKTLNNIFDSGKSKIFFVDGQNPSDDVQANIEKLMDILNTHASTNANVSGSEDALKNRTVAGINNITRGIQNHLIAQIAVDAVTKEPKAIAKTSVASSEKRLTQDNPLDKFVMQVQNGVGKQDVGIGAVSLKAYFAMDTAYNTKIANLATRVKNGTAQASDVAAALNEIVGNVMWYNYYDKDDKFHFRKGILAGVNLDPLIEALDTLESTSVLSLNYKNLNDERWIKNGVIDLKKCLNVLKYNSTKVDPAQVLSALISLSADNAKDLALAKLNATPELLDIYTYATMIGIPFRDIADVMMSDIFNFATKVGEVNIFDTTTHYNKTKEVIGYILKKDLPIKSATTLRILMQTIGVTVGNKEEDVLKAFNGLTTSGLQKLLDLVNQKITGKFAPKSSEEAEEEEAALSSMDPSNIDNGSTDAPITELAILKTLRDRIEWRIRQEEHNFTKEDYNKLSKIHNILEGVEEMSTLGRTLGINQGLNTNFYDIYAFNKNLENFIHKRARYNKKLQGFTVKDFVQDPSTWIKEYESVKTSFNILDVMQSVPHFWQMIKTTGLLDGAFSMTLARYNATMKFANALCDKANKDSLNRKEFKELQYYINDLFVAKFINTLDETAPTTLLLPKGSSIYNSFSTSAPVYANGTPLRLKGMLALGSFKKSMDDAIIPALQKMSKQDKYKENRFLKALVPFYLDKGNLKKSGWKLALDMMEISSSPNTDAMYTGILEDFNKIAHNVEFGMPIGDMFFLYNLLLNKDGFGRDSMSRLFEDLADVNPTPLLSSYYNMITSLDANAKTVEFGNVDEAAHRIEHNVPNTRIKGDAITFVKTNEFDFPLDLTSSIHLPTKEVVKVEVTTKDADDQDVISLVERKVSPEEAVVALANMIGARGGNVELINEDDLQNFPDAISNTNANAFILNGKVYFNISRCNLAAGIHEYAHLVLASMKFNKDEKIRRQYYDLLASVKNEENYQTYLEQYSDNDMVVGSDLEEEVFCHIFEDYLNNRMTPNSQVALRLYGTQISSKSLIDAFGFDQSLKDKDILKQPLSAILAQFGKDIFDLRKVQTKDIILGQKIASVKAKLAASEDSKNSLIYKCKD